jgi:dTDP-4-amino-4,6-dideoxygalactose transaminase
MTRVTKTRLDDLAVLGGAPAFSEPLHVGRPNIGDRERLLARIGDVLDRRWLTNDGPYLLELERRLADYLNVRHCVAVCNGTVGLEIAIRAAGLTGEVIVPSFTFIATAHALQWQGITPVFCDVDLGTHTLDPREVERALTPRTSGILGVHLWGRVCDVPALSAIARRHNLKLLFDAAHAFGCSSGGRMVGSFGDAEVFSFHATKIFNSFEGGAITTDDDELAARTRLMRNFGFAGYDEVIHLGTNGKMSEVSAAMALTSLEAMDTFLAASGRNYDVYLAYLGNACGIRMLTYDDAERSNHQYVVLEIDEAATKLTRDELVELLWTENVRARRYFYPGCHRMEPYRTLFPYAANRLPRTELLCRRVMTLPSGMTISTGEIGTICAIIRFALSHPREVSAALADRRKDGEPQGVHA